MRVHHLYLADTCDRDALTAPFLALLDGHPEFYYRIVGAGAREVVARGECPLRIAMASAHALIVLLGGSKGASETLADELRLARAGFSGALAVIAVLAPDASEQEARRLAVDRMIGWDGEEVASVVEECCRASGTRRCGRSHASSAGRRSSEGP